ncbi:ATP/GTP-binding protein [Sphingobacterium gobiense]|uniref:ATP/GTP-binding protein n=1 Tax=Sphingobacterium gobiense TaxID=1382456 RepID=A0A2S9JNN4_9SPHI|nr:ATP-binding protein [Sphingobacterium gobiense]PRD54706.1 ATP/GTP-binding protein [Sphingobacterium gobiense]
MKRIVISGTYCTGKTTLSLALSLATGIPATHALTMREILPTLFPGKTLRACSYAELLCLGMKRFEERIRAEAAFPEGFISDGCTLQEWLYGSTRLFTGADPDEYPWQQKLKQLLRYSRYRNFQEQLRGFEGMAKAYAKTHYDVFFHLPLEFAFVSDGHRPTSERFREASEQLLLQTYDEMGIVPTIVSGNLDVRLSTIIDHLALSPVMPLEAAIRHAEDLRKKKFDSVVLEHRRRSPPETVQWFI